MLKKFVFTSAILTLACTLLSAQAPPPYLSAAIADSERPAADTKRDPYFKPAQVLAFAAVRPGMAVADFMPGDGYYSRLFSRIVGPKGRVYAFYTREQDRPSARSKPGAALAGYANIDVLHDTAAHFAAPKKLDLVWAGLTYHDLHGPRFPGLDIAAVNKAVYAALKPGGIFIVVDRAARPGAGLSDLATKARIDEATVKSEVEAAGFRLVDESNVLRNPQDDLNQRVTKAQYEKRPDQFILKFRKPR